MRVVIIGATGLIGRELCGLLLSCGYEVAAVTRDLLKASSILGEKANIALWDGSDVDTLRAIIDNADGLINLAGENISSRRWTSSFKESIAQSRVSVGRSIAQAIEGSRKRPSVIIQASAVGYYGSRKDIRLSEDSSPGGDYLSEVCLKWEASTKEVEAMGVRRAVIRTGVVLTNEGGALPRLAVPFRFFAGGPLGNGHQWFPWIHHADEVRAIRFLLENENAHGAFNLTAPNSITLNDFCEDLGRILKRPSWLPVPSFALKALMGEMADQLLLASQRAVPERLLEMGFEFAHPDASNALSDIFAT